MRNLVQLKMRQYETLFSEVLVKQWALILLTKNSLPVV